MRLISLFITIVAGFGFLICSTSANAATCKECPSGCVAEQLVAALESDEESFSFDSCPAGCVAVANVMFFNDKSVCEGKVKADEQADKAKPVPVPVESVPVEPAEAAPDIQPVYPTPVDSATVDIVSPATKESIKAETAKIGSAKSGDAAKQADDLPKIDPSHNTDHRIVMSQTAYGLKKGQVVATAYGVKLLYLGFGILDVQYGITDSIQLGLVTTVPAGGFGVMPTIRFHKEINDYVAISSGIFVGYHKFLYGFFSEAEQQLVFGGSVEATFKVEEKHFFNLSLMMGGAGIKGFAGYRRDNDWDLINGVLMYPAVGYRGAFHKNWSFQFEVGFPLYVEKASSDEYDEDDNSDAGAKELTIAIFYGVRGHGEIIFGELGFMMIVSDWFDEMRSDYPLGFPYMSLGASF